MSAPRIGVGFSRGLAPADVVDCVKLAEEPGYESAWMAEGDAGDQFAVLGACAAATTWIRLGTSISSVFGSEGNMNGPSAAVAPPLVPVTAT